MRTSNRHAFSLLELILGIAIFSLVSVVVYSTFSQGVRLSHRSEVQNKLYRDASWAMRTMSKELENMVPYDFVNSYQDKKAVEGKSNEIKFIIASDNELRVIRYYLVSSDDESIHTVKIGRTTKKNEDMVLNEEVVESQEEYLVREETPFIDYLTDTTSDEKKIQVIAKNIKKDGLAFAYGYAKDKDSKEVVLEKSWMLNYIPSNIHIELTFLWPEKKRSPLTIIQDVLVPAGFLGKTEG